MFSLETLSAIFSWQTVLFVAVGVTFGLFVGAVPGLGASVGLVLLLPVTYKMETLPAIAMLIALYMGCEYGGSITSITLGIPGSSAAIPTLYDGRPMAENGEPGRALGISLTASTIGGLIGAFSLMFLLVPLSNLAYKLTDPEIFMICLLGLLSVVGFTSKSVPKTVMSIAFGMLFGQVGLDSFTGEPRFTLKTVALQSGFKVTLFVIGLYAVSQVISLSIGDLTERRQISNKKLNTHISMADFKRILFTALAGASIGIVFGIIPGLGAATAAMFVYTMFKRFKFNSNFGTGEPRGIACCEATNNAVVGGALIPYLVLGIPGSNAIATLSAGFTMHGLATGVGFLNTNPTLVYGLSWFLLIAVILMFVIGKYTTSLWARFLVVPDYILAPLILTLSFIGAYGLRNLYWEVWAALIFGVVGLFASKLDYSTSGFTLGFILSPLIENYFRRSLILSKGDFTIFVRSPFCIVMLILNILMIALPVRSAIQKRRAAASGNVEEKK